MEMAHKTASNLLGLDLIDKETMSAFDVSCLFTSEAFTPHELEALRKREGVSHGVFAGYLNVPECYVRDWELGTRKPVGPAIRLLSLIKTKGLSVLA